MIEPETRHEPCLFLYKLMIHSGKLLLSGYTFTALFLPVEKKNLFYSHSVVAHQLFV